MKIKQLIKKVLKQDERLWNESKTDLNETLYSGSFLQDNFLGNLRYILASIQWLYLARFFYQNKLQKEYYNLTKNEVVLYYKI